MSFNARPLTYYPACNACAYSCMYVRATHFGRGFCKALGAFRLQNPLNDLRRGERIPGIMYESHTGCTAVCIIHIRKLPFLPVVQHSNKIYSCYQLCPCRFFHTTRNIEILWSQNLRHIDTLHPVRCSAVIMTHAIVILLLLFCLLQPRLHLLGYDTGTATRTLYEKGLQNKQPRNNPPPENKKTKSID